ncbi:MAG: Rho termination factor N-terminal domain-containing protein, partial [Lachnospiraceae bacterium]|nr:Rho termination factor N-terminal domain-containing protein [Lachnospiraceae bacterium]
MEKYLEMTITQLKEEAKNRGLKGVSAMKKQELAELLSNADKILAQKREKKEDASAIKTEKTPVQEKTREITPHPQGAGERSAGVRTQNGQERPIMTRPQGSQERPVVHPQGAGERPVMSRPQSTLERPMQVRPQGG